jgi:uncharacterized membrane-anchored protein
MPSRNGEGPSWKHRRRLIYGAYSLGAIMIIFGLSTFWSNSQVSVEAIIAGSALITLIVSAYIGGATIEDVKLWNASQHADEEPRD